MGSKTSEAERILTDVQKDLLITVLSLGLFFFAPKIFPGPATSILSVVFAFLGLGYLFRLAGRLNNRSQIEQRKRQEVSHEDFLELKKFVETGGPKVAKRYAQALIDLKLGEDVSLWTQQDLFAVAERTARRDPAGDGWTIREPESH